MGQTISEPVSEPVSEIQKGDFCQVYPHGNDVMDLSFRLKVESVGEDRTCEVYAVKDLGSPLRFSNEPVHFDTISKDADGNDCLVFRIEVSEVLSTFAGSVFSTEASASARPCGGAH